MALLRATGAGCGIPFHADAPGITKAFFPAEQAGLAADGRGALLRPPGIFLAVRKVQTRLSPERARELLLANVSPQNTRPGTVIAATSRERPNYFYHWVRDGALVMNSVFGFYEAAADASEKRRYLSVLQDFVFLTRHQQLTKTPSGDGERKASGKDTVNLSDLGEPKFEVNGAAFTGDWGRPQNDGPALRALTLIRLANRLLDEGDVAFVKRFLYQPKLPSHSAIKTDLEHVSHHWREEGFDLWEEVRGHHFYTRLAQARALIEGAKLARRMGDPGAAEFYETEAAALKKEIAAHWDEKAGYVKSSLNADGDNDWKTSQLDVSVLLAALHSAGEDGYFGVTDERILATAQRLIDVFHPLYAVNREDLPGTVLGRYPEDRFDPIEKDPEKARGNPWVLATVALGELYFRAATDFQKAGQIAVTERNEGFFNHAFKEAGLPARTRAGETLILGTAAFAELASALRRAGENQIQRVYYHANPDGSLSEQIHRDTGYMHAAANLTWSYAAYLSAMAARSAASN